MNSDYHRDSETGPVSSNRKLVRAMLSRSGGTLPISLWLAIAQETDFCGYGDLARLAHTMRPYLPRLVALHIHTADSDAYAESLDHLDCLRVLRARSVKCRSSVEVVPLPGGTGFLSRPLDLPVLETLELATPKNSEPEAPHALPALAALHLRYKDPCYILTYLDISPRLRKLCLRPTDVGYDHDVDKNICELLQKKMCSVTDIQVMEVYPAVERAIVDLIDNDAS